MSAINKKAIKDLDAIIQRTDDELLAIFKSSAQDTIREANKPIAKGGSMPVDTGFLRSSGRAELNNIPRGPDVAPEGFTSRAVSGQASRVINSASLNDKIIYGWSARYAIYMENRYMFMRKAAQNWGRIVDKNIGKIKRLRARNG